MKQGSAQAKILFTKKETEFKQEIERAKENIKKFEAEMASSQDAFNDYRLIAIANEHLNMVTHYVNITDDMLFLKGVKHETYINEGRKTFYNAFLTLEKIFTDIISLEPTEIQAKIEKLTKFDPARKITFFRKMEMTLEKLQEAFGEKSKYRFGFNDMFARYGVIFKNAMNYRELSTRDPRKEFFVENDILLTMLLEILTKASDKMREKYEMATKQFDDMKIAIKIQEELRRIFILLKDQNAADEAKRKADAWRDKLEKDMQDKEKKKLQRR